MTFQDLYEQLGELTPEQRSQEVNFIKYGACDNYNWSGIAEDDYWENSDRLSLMVASHGGIYQNISDYEGGIPDCDYETLMEYSSEDEVEELIPDGMPFFMIAEG